MSLPSLAVQNSLLQWYTSVWPLFFSKHITTTWMFGRLPKFSAQQDTAFYLRFKSQSSSSDVCLHLGISTFMFYSRSNLLYILFSIEILQYIHLVALVCYKAGMSPKNLGVSSLVPLKRQIYTISQNAHRACYVCLSSALPILGAGYHVRFQMWKRTRQCSASALTSWTMYFSIMHLKRLCTLSRKMRSNTQMFSSWSEAIKI